MTNQVSVVFEDKIEYPTNPPYHPHISYPEYPFADQPIIGNQQPVTSNQQPNLAYESVRESLRLLGLDAENYSTSAWNPLKELVSPGSTVVIKPNAVLDINLKKECSVFASITHGSVLRAVTDYVYKALEGKGRLIIADAPLANSNFENWKKITGIQEIADFYKKTKGFEIEIYDLRHLYSPFDHRHGFAPANLKKRASRDPAGYREIDLGSKSLFSQWDEKSCGRLYGADYDRQATVRNHSDGHHRYKVAQTFLEADTIISIPKLKVHSKVGVTLNIKSMVGTQGDKNYIPHCRIGDPTRGGDEYPNLGPLQNFINRYRMWTIEHLLSKETPWIDRVYRIFFRPIQNKLQGLAHRLGRKKFGADYLGNIIGGAWYGNDTAWRMSLDLIRIILYSDRNGRIQDRPQRKFFSVIDGIVAGEDEGPLAPTNKPAGVIIAGQSPLTTDIVASSIMGFDFEKMPTFKVGLEQSWLADWPNGTKSLQIHSNRPDWQSLEEIRANHLGFLPSRGWRKHLEIQK